MHTGHPDTEERELLGGKYPAGTREFSVTENDFTYLVDFLLRQQDGERRRLASDLHNDAAQRLAFIQVESERLAQGLSADANLALLRVGQQAAELASSLREISQRLYPAVLEHLGLNVALEMLVHHWRDRGQAVVLSAEVLMYELPLETAHTLYRITDEVLHVFNRQAPEFEIALRLRQVGEETQLTVEGRGSDTNVVATLIGDRVSLLRMRQRARSVSGRLLLKDGTDSATALLVQVPNRTR